MNIQTTLMTNEELEDIFLIKALMYPRNLPFYNYLISHDPVTRLEIEGFMETAYFLRGGIDDRY